MIHTGKEALGLNDPMYSELIQGLLSILSTQAVQIVLYGSVARGTADPDSDIDIGRTNTASVPQAASRSAIRIMRFLFCRSTTLPARKRKKIVGRKVHTVSRVTLDAVPFRLYTQMMTA